jgi:WD40 repeat protein
MSHSGGVLATAHQGKVQVWSAGGGHSTLPSRGTPPVLRALAVSPDGKLLACGCGKLFLLVSLVSDAVQAVEAHDGEVRALAFTPDGRYLASGGADGLIRVWELPTGKMIKTLANVFSPVNALAITPNGKWLASGSGFLKGDLGLWSLPEGSAAGALAGNEHPVTCLAISPDSSRLATSSRNKVRLWNLPGAKEPTGVVDNQTQVNDMAFPMGGRVLACAGEDGLVRLWSVPRGELLGNLKLLKGPVLALGLPPASTQGLLAVDGAGKLWAGNVQKGSWKPLGSDSQSNL